MDRNEYDRILDSGHIDIEGMDADELNRLFEKLNREFMTIYRFVLAYTDYMNGGHDYTDEESITMLEAHLLTDICDTENPTVTGLAHAWRRSVSATSQTIRKLIAKGFIYRENSAEDAKVFYLRPTDKGRKFSEAHKRYDSLDIIKTLKSLHHRLSCEEIMSMFHALGVYTDLLERDS